MKALKHIIFILAVTTLIVSLNSCQKEGVYNPQQKIATIYKDYGEGQELYAQYIWNKDLLSQINYIDGTTTSYTYNSKNQATKITMGTSWAHITYDGSDIDEVSIYMEGSKVCDIDFEHKGNKIVSAEIDIINMDLLLKQLSTKGSLTQRLFNAFIPSNMNRQLVEACQAIQPNKGDGIQMDINYTWTGKNISKVDVSMNMFIFNLSLISEYTYDNKMNPFYNGIVIDFNEGDIDGWISSWLNKNNALTCTSTISMTGETPEVTQYTYQYEYEGDYPIKVIETEKSDDDIDYGITIYEYSK